MAPNGGLRPCLKAPGLRLEPFLCDLTYKFGIGALKQSVMLSKLRLDEIGPVFDFRQIFQSIQLLSILMGDGVVACTALNLVTVLGADLHFAEGSVFDAVRRHIPEVVLAAQPRAIWSKASLSLSSLLPT